jgi:hypothetical protein
MHLSALAASVVGRGGNILNAVPLLCFDTTIISVAVGRSALNLQPPDDALLLLLLLLLLLPPPLPPLQGTQQQQQAAASNSKQQQATASSSNTSNSSSSSSRFALVSTPHFHFKSVSANSPQATPLRTAHELSLPPPRLPPPPPSFCPISPNEPQL